MMRMFYFQIMKRRNIEKTGTFGVPKQTGIFWHSLSFLNKCKTTKLVLFAYEVLRRRRGLLASQPYQSCFRHSCLTETSVLASNIGSRFRFNVHGRLHLRVRLWHAKGIPTSRVRHVLLRHFIHIYDR